MEQQQEQDEIEQRKVQEEPGQQEVVQEEPVQQQEARGRRKAKDCNWKGTATAQRQDARTQPGNKKKERVILLEQALLLAEGRPDRYERGPRGAQLRMAYTLHFNRE